MSDNNKLTVIDGETLADMNLPPTKFCVQTLLPQGVTILGGAPKIGKSWMVLELCVRVAKGESIWGMPTMRGATLVCTGRDIEYRELELKFSKESCTWELVQDSMENPTLLLPKELTALIEYMAHIKSYHAATASLSNSLIRTPDCL